MSGIYFSLLAILVLTGFFVGRSRASAVAGGKLADLHSLPTYHGLFAGSAVFIPMLIVVRDRRAADFVPGAEQRHVAFPGRPSQADPLQRGALLRDIAQSRRRAATPATATAELRSAASSFVQHPAVGQLDPAGLRRRDRPR